MYVFKKLWCLERAQSSCTKCRLANVLWLDYPLPTESTTTQVDTHQRELSVCGPGSAVVLSVCWQIIFVYLYAWDSQSSCTIATT